MNIFGNPLLTAIFFSVIFAILYVVSKIMTEKDIEMNDVLAGSMISFFTIIGSLAAYKPIIAESFNSASAPF